MYFHGIPFRVEVTYKFFYHTHTSHHVPNNQTTQLSITYSTVLPLLCVTILCPEKGQLGRTQCDIEIAKRVKH